MNQKLRMMKSYFFAFICLLALTNCTKSKPTQTIANLKAAIIGETTASAKYAAFAQEAAVYGNDTIENLFKATSISEAIHAANHRKVLLEMGETIENFSTSYQVKSTNENLQSALEGETYEVTTMYPPFIEKANSEAVEKAQLSFQYAFDTEKKHQELFTKALEANKRHNRSNLSYNYLVCPICGNTYEKESVEDKCSFCQTSKDLFVGI